VAQGVAPAFKPQYRKKTKGMYFETTVGFAKVLDARGEKEKQIFS
jgi:hypothetical protein